MNRFETENMITEVRDATSDAARHFYDGNAYEFEADVFRARQTLRKLESVAIEWADEVERSERIKRKQGSVK